MYVKNDWAQEALWFSNMDNVFTLLKDKLNSNDKPDPDWVLEQTTSK